MEKILLVNDSSFENMIMKDMLTDLDYEVEASNEYNALIQVENFKPDIIIVNLIMKQTTGDKLIEKIKKSNTKVRCLLSSSNKLNLEDYKHIGIDGIITIPVDKILLKKALFYEEYTTGEYITKVKLTFCPYCGQKIKKDDAVYAFCPYCGAKL